MSVLAGLSRAGQIASTFILSGIRQGMSGNSILQALVGTPLGYRREIFLDDIKIIREANQRWSTIRYVRRDRTPTERHYLPTQKRMVSPYQTVIEIKGYNPRTEQEEVRHVTVHHSTLRTRQELEDAGELEAKETSPTFQITSVMPVSAFKNPERTLF